MKNPYKVTYVYKDFDVFNGLIATFLILSRKIESLKFDLEICVFNYKGSECGTQYIENGGKLLSLNSKWEDNPWIIWKLYRHFKRTKPHVVQTFILKPNIYGIVAAKLAKVPVIIATDLTLKDQAPTPLKRLRDSLLYPIYHFLLRWVDHVICVSEAVKTELPSRIKNSRASVVYSPIDCEAFIQRQGTKVVKNNHIRPMTIGIVGRLSEEKGHLDLISVFAEIVQTSPDTRLMIVGDGYMKETLKQCVQSLGVEEYVDFTGFQYNVIDFIRRMDLFVLPSRTEGFGLVILEAMAVGLPVVATNVGGIPEIVIHEETGLLINPGENESLKKAIVDLLSDVEKRRRFGRNARERVITNFHPDNFIKSHQHIYEVLLQEKGRLPEPPAVGF